MKTIRFCLRNLRIEKNINNILRPDHWLNFLCSASTMPLSLAPKPDRRQIILKESLKAFSAANLMTLAHQPVETVLTFYKCFIRSRDSGFIRQEPFYFHVQVVFLPELCNFCHHGGGMMDIN